MRRWATAIAVPLALMAGVAAAAPAHADPAPAPAPVGDPALPNYPGLSAKPGSGFAAQVATTPLPCDANGADETTARADAVTRARSWLAVVVPYSQNRCYRNQYGDYRTDCSGMVAMAWGLGGRGSDWWTGNLADRSHRISRGALQPGDALLRHTGDTSENHVALFVRWGNSEHTRLVVIEQTGSRDTIERTWETNYAGLYTPVRYDHIVEEAEEEEENTWSPDVTGDGFADLVATKADGTQWLYSNNIVRDDGRPYSAVRQIGSGWDGFDRVIAADVTGDGFSDIVATKADGTMWLYSNNIVRDDGRPYSAVRQIGSGWGGFDKIVGADVTGDGFADLVATKADGTMWLYSNNIVRDDGRPYSAFRQIGSGWGGFDRIIAADATGDGFTDLVATKADGTMWLYSNNIVRDDGRPYSAVRQIGHGWENFDRLVGADVTGDRFTDLVATKADGTMWLYSNNIVRDDGIPYSAVRQIGSGWGAFERITA
ncbi:VCBS repeat-containing protein [Actinoplanes sp. NBRC 103695]|uniref:C40 family peptidase n=1 Tax=Actinoplanes sp. NBRC 103695 TaxID=3032202 RepID=UPI0024A113D5|nr:VCBS repeat-containing protein [Actinoplanes sp. NBRC 103695]GLY97932.1 hypothetical protein Acsp02_51860 [Actinoplanes sp. NBRC 103695]